MKTNDEQIAAARKDVAKGVFPREYDPVIYLKELERLQTLPGNEPPPRVANVESENQYLLTIFGPSMDNQKVPLEITDWYALDAAIRAHMKDVLPTMAEIKANGNDGCVCMGGGSTIGLGKAVALETGLPSIVVPTTYAGS